MQTHPWAINLSRITFQLRSYGVLITVSSGYPPLKGRFSTHYSPVRHFPLTEVSFSFDLHVWSTPPAFVLSQDQTLHCQKVYVLHSYRIDISCSTSIFSLNSRSAFVLSFLNHFVELTSISSTFVLFCFHKIVLSYSVFNVLFISSPTIPVSPSSVGVIIIEISLGSSILLLQILLSSRFLINFKSCYLYFKI